MHAIWKRLGQSRRGPRLFQGRGVRSGGKSLRKAGGASHEPRTRWSVALAEGDQTLRASIMRSMIGCRMTSIAKPILPPGTTMVFRRDMKESLIMLSR
jgi:hypothetical protein